MEKLLFMTKYLGHYENHTDCWAAVSFSLGPVGNQIWSCCVLFGDTLWIVTEPVFFCPKSCKLN